jgi:hypothetical protein
MIEGSSYQSIWRHHRPIEPPLQVRLNRKDGRHPNSSQQICKRSWDLWSISGMAFKLKNPKVMNIP